MQHKPYPSETQERFIVRLPDGMRDQIADAAKGNNRSMNAEIVARLTNSFDQASEVSADPTDIVTLGLALRWLAYNHMYLIQESAPDKVEELKNSESGQFAHAVYYVNHPHFEERVRAAFPGLEAPALESLSRLLKDMARITAVARNLSRENGTLKPEHLAIPVSEPKPARSAKNSESFPPGSPSAKRKPR